jgi:chaperonin GroES
LGTGKKDGEDYTFTVKVGDRVIISKYGGTQVKYDDAEYTILREDDILAVVA